MEEFIRIVAIMLRGTKIEKIRLCFTCFDLNDTLEVTREEVTDLFLEAINDKQPYFVEAINKSLKYVPAAQPANIIIH
ncbi:hypothetical protein TNCV_1139511 [Trichonephila clavipes]|nr:hypothetical protein TNCV_1139511 [Trichonephila clavipes]